MNILSMLLLLRRRESIRGPSQQILKLYVCFVILLIISVVDAGEAVGTGTVGMSDWCRRYGNLLELVM